MEKAVQNKARSKIHNLKNGIFWSSRLVSSTVTNLLFTSYLSFYATDVLGMSLTLVATVMLVTKLFDGVTDLIAGFIVDNTHTRFGKARPYDWCIPFVALFTILTFSAPSAPPVVQAVYIGVMYVLTSAVFGTLLGASDNVYLLRAFPKEAERNSVYAICTVFGQIVSLIVGVLVPKWLDAAGVSQSAWTRVIMLVIIPLTIFGMIRFFAIKEVIVDEPAEKSEKKDKKQGVGFKDGIKAIGENPYIIILTLAIFIIVIASGFLNTAASYYFIYFVGDLGKMSIIAVSSFASLIMLVLFVPLANRFGKGRIMKVSLLVAVIGGIIRWVGGTNLLTMGIGLSMTMFGIMPATVYFPLFLFDIMDYSEWKTGKRVEGVLSVFPNFALKVAGGLSVSLGGFVMGAAGYVGGQETQTESAMRAIDLTFNALPTICLAVMAAVMIVFYNLDKRMPEIKNDLDARKAAQPDD